MRNLKITSLAPKDEKWIDRDVIMLHACFQILKDCVEKENLFQHSPAYAKSKKGKIAKKLYDWWEIRRTQTYHDIDDLIDNKQLIKLIGIRETLWT